MLLQEEVAGHLADILLSSSSSSLKDLERVELRDTERFSATTFKESPNLPSDVLLEEEAVENGKEKDRK